jgi:hypothetical protein
LSGSSSVIPRRPAAEIVHALAASCLPPAAKAEYRTIFNAEFKRLRAGGASSRDTPAGQTVY